MHPKRIHFLVVAAAAGALCHSTASAGEIKLARHPDFHDGKIVFSYAGDLWTVRDDGSNPQRLTAHRARSAYPRFSPDGKWIAFSSARYGSTDVFVMPAEGGPARRLTFHSAGDTVVGWSRDSQRVIFNSSRGLLYPGIPNLYEVPVDGGLEQPLPTDWGYWGSYSPDGQKFAYNRHPAPWSRKHYRGSYSGDLWLLDVANKSSKRILDSDLADDMKPNNLWPMYANGYIYFVSDRDVMAKAGSPEVMSSTNNIWRVREYGSQPEQVTHHTSGSLFFPSISADGKTIVYEEGFGLWKLDVASGQSKEIKIHLTVDEKENNHEVFTAESEADWFHLSPSGKRAVISTHGELFTIATDRGDIQRITRTAGGREVQPAWSPDGKWIAFIGDKNGQEDVWICDERGGQAKQLSNTDLPEGQVQWSPDSKSLLYTAGGKKLYVHKLDDGQPKEVATAEVMGFGGAAIMNPRWSPDGRWISFAKAGDNLLPHVYIIPAEGGKEQRITDDTFYSDSGALWTGDGKRIVFLAGGDVGNIGQMGRSTAQLYVVSLLPEDQDTANKGIDSEEEAVKAERRDRGRRGGPPPTDDTPRDEDDDTPPAPRRGGAPAKVDVKIDFDRITRRVRQLTRLADNIGSVAVSPDGQVVAFSTFGTEGGRSAQSLWTINIDGDRQTRVTQSGTPTAEEEQTPGRRSGFGGYSGLQFTKDGRSLYYRQGGGIYAVNVPGGGSIGGSGAAGFGGRRGGGGGNAPAASSDSSSTASSGNARRVNFTARVEVDNRTERQQVFNESWRVMKFRFYDEKMHGVDWEKMKARYEPLLDHTHSSEDMQDVVNMMIGELNASHTGLSGGGGGGGGRRGGSGRSDARFPGFDLEADASGFYKVAHVYKNGPADKDFVKIKTGDFVLAIDGHELKAGENYWKRYADAAGNKIEFTVNSKPQAEGAWKTKVTPVSTMQHANMQYGKWVADRRDIVDKLSNGEIGYLHIRQMNETSLRQFERDLAALHNKKGLIIDQRFNPGGNIDQELLQILQQKQYQYTRVRDANNVTRPFRGFFGPMVVMANERSTSDAEVFPDGFRTLKLGKVVGVTTYGAVIGTGSYQMMDGSSIRTPGSGLWNVSGQNLENYGVPPDVYVDNTPEDFLKGRDAQLEKAIEVVKAEMKNKKEAARR
jgi:tricorn protease